MQPDESLQYGSYAYVFEADSTELNNLPGFVILSKNLHSVSKSSH